MLLKEIVDFLEQKAPAATAEEWDNVGLLVDTGCEEIATAVVALDATPAALAFAVENGAKLLITHHPIIFSPLSAVTADMPAMAALTAGVSVLSLHTNLDKAAGGVNDTLARLLALRDVRVAADGMTRLGELEAPMTAPDFAAYVSKTLDTPVSYTYGRMVKTVAVCGGGAGDGVFAFADAADAYVTGEIKHHEFLAAKDRLFTAVAAGHYATEVPVVDTLTAWLREAFPTLSVLPFYDEAPYKSVLR